MIINFYLAVSVMIVLMLIVPTALVFVLREKQQILKIVTIIFSAIYFIILFIGTTTVTDWSGDTIKFYYETTTWFSMNFRFFDFGVLHTIMNIILLFPIGFIVYVFSKERGFLKTVVWCFIVSVIIELYQWILPVCRNTEISDIILNTISGVISGLYMMLLLKLGAFRSKNNK